jgi:MurNAc alpha-1-phosphate uridylyltransferase
MIKAMILAAGKGERMGELTRDCPKPLLPIGGQPLIVHHLKKLVSIGIKECVINLRYLGDKIQQALGDGRQFGIRLHYSVENEALETAGGIIQALPFFEDQPFMLMSADVLSDYPVENLLKIRSESAHLVMVANPEHHPEGDFSLQENGYLSLEGKKLTYANIGLYHPKLFATYPPGYRKLAEVLRGGIIKHSITGECYTTGEWINIDTPQRLMLANSSSRNY